MLTGTVTASPLGALVAFGAGMLSFLSPCVLPLVPGYVSMVSGLSAAELSGAPAGTATPAGPGAAVAVTRAPLRPLVKGIALFVAGFTVVFTALGAAASGLGHLLVSDKGTLSVAAGALIIVFGVVLLVGAMPASFWRRPGLVTAGAGRLVADRRLNLSPSSLGSWAAPVMGMAFAFAWTPCIGPVLGAVLGLAAARSTLGGGVVLLVAYSLGLGIPFLVTGLAFGRLTALYGRARRGLWVVHVAGGAVLVVFGILLVIGELGWLSSQVSTLMSHIGLGRLTTS